MFKQTHWLISAVLFVLLIAASCSSRPQQFYDNGVPDAEYIRIASNTEEAKAFLVQYPDAEIFVDRSSDLAVDFRVGGVPPDTTQHWQGIRLRVFIDSKKMQASRAFIQCSSEPGQQNFVEDHPLEYLGQVADNQSCPAE